MWYTMTCAKQNKIRLPKLISSFHINLEINCYNSYWEELGTEILFCHSVRKTQMYFFTIHLFHCFSTFFHSFYIIPLIEITITPGMTSSTPGMTLFIPWVNTGVITSPPASDSCSEADIILRRFSFLFLSSFKTDSSVISRKPIKLPTWKFSGKLPKANTQIVTSVKEFSSRRGIHRLQSIQFWHTATAWMACSFIFYLWDLNGTVVWKCFIKCKSIFIFTIKTEKSH